MQEIAIILIKKEQKLWKCVRCRSVGKTEAFIRIHKKQGHGLVVVNRAHKIRRVCEKCGIKFEPMTRKQRCCLEHTKPYNKSNGKNGTLY